jgi:hypothetical protein
MMSLLGAAFSSIARRYDVAVRLLAWPLFLCVVVEVFNTIRLVQTDYEGGQLSSWIVFFVNLYAVGVIAVGWHRHVLMRATIGFWPAPLGPIYRRYVWQWFVLGFIATVILLAVIASIYGVLYFALDDPYFWETMFFYDSGLNDLFGAPFGILIVPPIIAFLWLLFRIGVILPHLALGRSEQPLFWAWSATRSQARDILIAACIAGVLQALVICLPFVLYEMAYLVSADEVSTQMDYAMSVFYGISYPINALIGAAILTTIYARIPAKVLDQS